MTEEQEQARKRKLNYNYCVLAKEAMEYLPRVMGTLGISSPTPEMYAGVFQVIYGDLVERKLDEDREVYKEQAIKMGMDQVLKQMGSIITPFAPLDSEPTEEKPRVGALTPEELEKL